ncbi:MAG: hypothetical protein IT380_27465 [Myxococcales bacterium]|nr:hypothetical protein [Myxococcales bacterium]
MGFLGKVFKGIGKVVKKVGDFAKKAVAFGAKIMNGPLGTILSFIPITAPFARAATLALNVANGALNGGGLKGIVSGLVSGLGGMGGVLGKAGSLLSGAGLSTVGGLLSKASSSGVMDIVSGLMGPRKGDQSPVAQAETFNLSQLSAFRMAELFRAQQAAA